MSTDPTKINRDWSKLDPAFAEKLKVVIAQANVESKHADGTAKFPHFDRWELFEGYRSQARQDWLYGQGRTRPGAIVTRLKVSNHTGSHAGDVVWRDKAGEWHWDGPQELWAILGHCARAHGLVWGGDWTTFKDTPHIEAPT